MALTADQKAVVTACVPLLAEHGLEVTKTMYSHMLTDYPSLRDLFTLSAQLTGHQPSALAGAVYAYAANINDLTPVLPAVERIAHKHVSVNISAPQYAIVGECLLKALREVLGADVFTDQVHDVWAAAYWQLANLMIKREDDIVNSNAAEEGGWKGWRQMRLVRKVKESSVITSFYWAPVDGGALPVFKPGQYISIRTPVPGGLQIRQYSLSDAPLTTTSKAVDGLPAQYFRNSVKQELGAHPGLISNILHNNMEEGSVVDMANPTGDFFLDVSKAQGPLVLISAGVGLTPMLSMLSTLHNAPDSRPISYIHVTRSKETHAFAQHIKSLSESNANISSFTFHSRPGSDEIQGQDYDFSGRLDLGRLDAKTDLHLDNPETEYYICGPSGFMMGAAGWLQRNGVDDKRIKMELFAAGEIAAKANAKTA